MQQLMQRSKRSVFSISKRRKSVLVAISIAIFAIGWLRIEGTFRYYLEHLGFDSVQLDNKWYGQTFFPALITSADLTNTNFIFDDEGFVGAAKHKNEFSAKWCGDISAPKRVCDDLHELNSQLTTGYRLDIFEINFCKRALPDEFTETSCIYALKELSLEFELQWRSEREAYVKSLRPTGFSGKDLRNADLSGSNFPGADFTYAQLIGAKIQDASFEYANLTEANFTGSQIRDTALTGADLWKSDFSFASLSRVKADLTDWQATKLDWATFTEVNFIGAYFRSATFKHTLFDDVNLRGAAFRDNDLSRLEFYQDNSNLEHSFRDLSATPPRSAPMLARATASWANDYYDNYTFPDAWAQFQRAIGFPNHVRY